MQQTWLNYAIGTALLFSIGFGMTAHADDSARQPKSVFKDCDRCPDMVVIAPGTFTMGSTMEESGHPDEKPQRSVTLAKSFAVGKTEVTFDQWEACVAEKRCASVSDDALGRGTRPVINVGWNDAQGYAAWLAEKTGKPYRLLSEAQWEYAARAGTTTAWFWGAAEDSYGARNTCEFANTHDESGKKAHPNYVWSNHLCDDGYPETAPVAQYKPNAFGLHDMLGNVREWVADCHHAGYKGAPSDGSVWNEAECEQRLVRGGAWIDGPSTTRAAYRHPLPATHKNYQVGFRVARDLAP